MAQPGRKREAGDREADGGRGENVNQVAMEGWWSHVGSSTCGYWSKVSINVKPLGAIWSN